MDAMPTSQEVSYALKKGIELLTEATEEDKKKNYEEASRLYEFGAEYFLHAIKSEELKETSVQKIRERTAIYLERSEKLKKYLQEKYMKKPITDSNGERLTKEDSEEEEDLSDLLLRLDVAEKPYVKWRDVFGLHQGKGTLEEAFIMPLKFPHLFTSKRRPWNSILLYGPPGTGKTSLAHALATEAASSTFILLSNCLGESGRLFKNLFMNERTQSPTIILIDEIDVLFNTEAARKTKMELLTYIKGPRKESDGILILATTSEPWLLDDALLKRFEKKIYTPLPNTTERLQILKFCLSETPHNLTEGNLQELAQKTEGYSGGDISALVQDSLMQPIRKVKTATHYKRVSGPSRSDRNVTVDDLLTPCSPSCSGAIEVSWEEIPSDKLLEPVINMCDLILSLASSKPTTDEYGLRRYENFQEYFC
ncbi:Vacuolar protein sorting-associated protein 4A [Araneus ventricosus]|uniref:Vacuolar protein sorting-associated protein 4A n=1 Tax=Araneus ventricosus TaxID=182803 RepID=A0A4Y2CPY9_ARAVE|nr:Vacuolar protein sorting-associated protein 4A [Araneus ventricosus]